MSKQVEDLIKDYIQKNKITYFNADNFASAMSGALRLDEGAILRSIEALTADGFLATRNGKLIKSADLGYKVGVISINANGAGFVDFDGARGGDIFISPSDTNGAITGDKVFIKQKDGKRRGNKPAFEVVQIISRGVRNVVGTFIHGKKEDFIIPDDERVGKNFVVLNGKEYQGKSGQKVVARFSGEHKARKVEINEVIGSATKAGNDILSIIRAHNLYEEFSPEVEAEANKVAVEPTAADMKGRVDFRKKLVFACDPYDCRDRDDALSLWDNEDGTRTLGVHISAVEHYVKAGSELDKEAFKRGTSVYFPDRVLPMIPTKLSNGVCSLDEGKDRLTLSVMITLDKKNKIIKHEIVKSVIRCGRAFAYEEVQAVIDDAPGARAKEKKFAPMILQLAELTLHFEKERRARGEVILTVPEPKIVLDPETFKIVDVIAHPHNLSHRIVETFMILANEVIAEHYNKMDMPFVYRIHEKPDAMKVQNFLGALTPFGVQHHISPESPMGIDYQAMLDGVAPEILPIVSMLALRSMQKARYSEVNVGHFGLGSSFYCHFTSPIRRYPDLAIHRIISDFIGSRMSSHKIEELKEFVASAAEQSSKTELNAVHAERDVNDLKRAEFMHEHIGEDFDGVINGIKDFGIFVYLPNTVEGLIRIENMTGDTFVYDEKTSTLRGRTRTFKMGDPIRVKCVAVNMSRKQIEFTQII
ncbi:MAG: ribonuclease R [Christensenellaceae bacterium]|jgi:ribonuclease R|nr:ribonuclease R [Christensenellaceae bacterium]